jgi:ubiquitin C-terminal hydrolase
MDIALGISKFKNVDGVSCYMISILHILQQIPDFICILLNIKPKKKTITLEILRLFKLSINNDNRNISPISFKKIITEKNDMWGEIEHQDSQEFYTFLINQIEEECGRKIIYIPSNGCSRRVPSEGCSSPSFLIQKELENRRVPSNGYSPCAVPSNGCSSTCAVPDADVFSYKKDDSSTLLQLIAIKYIQTSEIKDYSFVKNLFVGYLISNTTCSLCNTNSPSFESFITLPLSIPINKNTKNIHKFGLEECFDNFVSDEKLDKHNKLKCCICSIKNRSIKKIQIWKAPKILVIQLKRFVTNQFGIQTSKILNHVNYPINNFDIIHYFHPDSPYKNNTLYNLIGINLHFSIGDKSINAGHYVSIVKNNYDNEWYVFNDSNDVIKIEKESSLQNNNAYLLFYLRLD